MLFSTSDKNSSNTYNKEYCENLEKILKFFDSHSSNINYNEFQDKQEHVLKNLNIIYKNYFKFQIMKEYYTICKK